MTSRIQRMGFWPIAWVLSLICIGSGIGRAEAQQAPQTKPAASQTTPPDADFSDSLTGNWNGYRTWLHNHGVDITSGYKEELGGGVYGGVSPQWSQSGEFDIGAKIDTEKAFGFAGGLFETTITVREGEPPPGDLLQQSLEVYGRGNIARLTEFWYRQKLFDDRLTIQFGRMPQGGFNDFTCDFLNLTFCGSPSGNTNGNYIYTWPIAQWAAWARYDFGDFDFMAGAYTFNPDSLNQQFLAGAICCTEGAVLRVELGWTPSFGGLVGHYQAGFWDDTAGNPDVLTGTNGQPFVVTGLPALQRANSYGVYLQGIQQITGKANYDRDGGWKDTSGLSVFFNFVQSDVWTSTLDNQVAAGLWYAAPFASRPADSLGLAVGRTQYNARATQSLALATPGAPTPQAEYPLELFYSFQATPWWDIRPDFQFIVHPGGYVNASNMIILGLRSDVRF